VTTSKDILHDIAAGKGPRKYFFALGFAGWTANQLEDELILDSWLVAPVDYEIIFNIPVGDRWKHAASSIGVDLERYIKRSGLA
jgi:putative transcriptional regulator